MGLINDVIANWDASILEKHWPEIVQALKTGLYDADPDARAYARQTYETMQTVCPRRAEALLQVCRNTLDNLVS